MARERDIWQLKFQQKLPIGDWQVWKKEREKMQKIYQPLVKLSKIKCKLFCNSQIHVLTKIYGNHFTILMVTKVQLFENWTWSPAFLFSKLLMGMCCWKGLLLIRLDQLWWGCIFNRVTRMGPHIFVILVAKKFWYVGIHKWEDLQLVNVPECLYC